MCIRDRGMKTLTWSAGFEEEEEVVLTEKEARKREKLDQVINGVVMAVSFLIAIAIFMVLPYFLSDLFKTVIPSYVIRTILEGVIRILIFVGYIWLISRMEDIQMCIRDRNKTGLIAYSHGEYLTLGKQLGTFGFSVKKKKKKKRK